MKTKITWICLLGFGVLCSSKTAGSANNDPLILYALALIILGMLIGFPYIMAALKKRLSKKSLKNKTEGDTSGADS